MVRRLAAVGLVGFAMAMAVASCEEEAAEEQLCDPGSNVFCRCRGTLESGTKTCNGDGDGFGPCENAFGECDEVVDTSGSGGSSSSSSTASSMGGMKPKPEPGDIYAPCNLEEGQGCDDGLECAQGYCTKTCSDYLECQPVGDCVVVGGGSAMCAPYCTTQSDCDDYGTASGCGHTDEALPPFDVVVCANHGDVSLPPDGYPCETDAACNLGFLGTARVCDGFGCTDGCHVDDDCVDANCSASGGQLGQCGGGASADACPGLPLSLSAASPTAMASGDTSAAPPPSEAEGESGCTSLSPTEEHIYQLSVVEPGTVIALVDTNDPGYDPIVYVRAISCEGTQIACADDAALGAGEIVEFEVFANEELWLFVDGFNGSVGSYTLELDFTP